MKASDKYFKIKGAIILWGPVLLQMGLIFFFSSRPSGSAVIEKFPLSAPVGHLAGYFILSLLLYRALNRADIAWSGKAASYTLLIGFLYALSDEFHQLFVPGREAAFGDVAVDTLGIVFLLALVKLRSLICK